jgi:hypothetical protein
MKNRETLDALYRDEIIDLEGLKFRKIGNGEELNPGDLYIAERNTGPKLLTCRKNNRDDGWIVPTTMEYCYDTWECIKVELVE